MLRNFFLTALRNVRKHKAFAAINFIGLATGCAMVLLVIAYVRSELSYDLFHTQIDRLYRLRYTVPNGLELATTPPPIAPLMKQHFPGVEEAARVYGRNVSITRPDQDVAYEESSVFFVDSAFTKMFTLQFVKGNPERALHDKFTVLINEEMAKKYFGDGNPIGESLILSGKQSFKVIGVVKDFPENSHIRFNMLVPFDDMFDLEDAATENVLRNNLAINFIISHSYTYVLLKPGADPRSIDQGMPDFLKKYANPNVLIGQIFTMMPVKDIHLKSTLQAEPSATNSMTTIYIFSAVGLLTLVIACINYINLSTAQALTRVKEIGIRKILGSVKRQLIGQFLAESFLFCIISLVMALFIYYFSLPILNQLTGKNLDFTDTLDLPLGLYAAGLVVLVTLLSGGYPAYFVTRFESIQALRGAATPGDGNSLLRKGLVVLQLSIACLLLTGSMLIMKQLDYVSNRPLGYQKDLVINVPLYSQNLNAYFQQSDTAFRSRLQTYRDLVESQQGVRNTTLASGSPGTGAIYRGTIPEGFSAEDNLFVANLAVDYDFLKAYDMELVAGRAFSREAGTDEKEAFLINETAVREFKWETPEKALGKTINREGKKGTVVGVVKDFNFASLTTAITGLLLSIDRNQFNTLSIRFDNSNVEQTIRKLEAEWNRVFPEKAFEYSFLDEQLNQQYSTFNNFGDIIQSFTLVAILIACLGVYGLVLFTVQRKVKEIGIRKVLGANVGGLLLLIYRDFVWLILIGFVLAVPVSYYLINEWFNNFIYHTDVDVLTYLLSLLIVGAIVTVTISYQSVQAARANPVRSLRSE